MVVIGNGKLSNLVQSKSGGGSEIMPGEEGASTDMGDRGGGMCGVGRIIPHRWSQPEAYRLYLELLSRYAFSFHPVEPDASKERIIKSVDAALQLSKTYQVHVLELGHTMVLFFFSIVVGLLDSTLDDWGLPVTFLDRASGVARSGDYLNMDIDSKGNKNFKQSEHREQMRRTNSFLAMEVLGTLMENRKAKVLLRLVHLNMPEGFNGLLRRIQFLEAHKLASSILKSANQLLVRLSANIRGVLDFEYQLNKHQLIGMLIDIGSNKLVSGCNFEAVQSACWVPFDIYMENVMDVKHLPVRSTIVILRETIRTLQGFNRASWQETFLALWLSALRLVQRERDPLEGPIPHLESRLCMLLSIAPLAITQLLEDEVNSCNSSSQGGREYGYTEIGYGHEMDRKCHASRKHGLISSLQVLGHFSALLCPPSSIADAANLAAAKAAGFISNSKNGKDSLGGGSHGNTIVKSGGNMRHLIVEACIARKLIDTSAYFWPGYVSASVISMSDSSPIQGSPWSTFMEGAPLTGPLIDALIAIPASSLAELEKLYHVALNGSEEEKSAAAKILCGASLRRGWNIQEHVVHSMVKLLSPPIPPNFTGTRSHLIDYLPMLSAILFGASSIDTVHILSLHGVAVNVLPQLIQKDIIESSDQLSCHCLCIKYTFQFDAFITSYLKHIIQYFTFQFTCISGRGRAIGSELTLEYLLILHNNRIASHNSAAHDETSSSLNRIESTSDKPVYIDSYPKLRAWYCQNRSCIASTLSGLCNGSPVHQVANKILNMIYWKMTKSGASSGNPSTPSGSSISGSTASTGEDAYQRPMLPAWEVLEAVPLVLEAILTACAHGILSSRDLTTGLRDLVDFLPASLVVIISYFSAEVSRGDSTAMLPLPMAALVSLTITFKLDKRLEYIHAVAGTSLANCASSCPWPSMPIIGSLWVQKVRRWHNFIVGSCSLSVFRQDKEAVAQLLRSCFTSFLGLFHVSKSPLASQNGVVGLLGDINWAHCVCPSIAPGLLYLRSCRTIHNVQYVNHVIIGLVAEFARELASRWASKDSQQLKSSQSSLALATTKVKEVATLGASLLCVTGGIQLVQELYQETLPTWLLSTREEKLGEVSSVSRIMEGYAMAYLLVLSGSFIWGLGARPPSWTFSIRARIVRTHLDFLAGVLEGNISLGCDPATWKSYVSCLVGLLVSLAPTWIRDVKRETLRKLANGLRGWHECELALSLLEKGGPATLGSAAELVNVIN
uniref:Mediator of RNA polymerase II transcription subunit 33A n=1 Tax=Vitis vinifera TaxID=29760 RepID=A5AXR2_VITVI|nr:hypothetical protein VITISV_036441 [Vitis vinifera]